MKNFLTIIIILLLVSCQTSNQQKSVNDTQDTIKSIGGNKDKNGCYTSAGYIWSQLKKDCVRPFEIGLALESINTTDTYHTAAFVIWNKDLQKAEIFVPSENESLILNQENDSTFTNGTFHLVKEDTRWTLLMKKIKLYQENK